jgi:hypothetical protein
MLSNMTTYGVEVLDDKNDKANFMGQCRVERIWKIPGRGASDLFGGAHDCR